MQFNVFSKHMAANGFVAVRRLTMCADALIGPMEPAERCIERRLSQGGH
jgi:hypothetical protein